MRRFEPCYNVSGVTLNESKCIYNAHQFTFLGHMLDHNGIRPAEKNVEAIRKMKSPTYKSELQRVLGMATYLARFVTNLAHILHPLTSMLSNK